MSWLRRLIVDWLLPPPSVAGAKSIDGNTLLGIMSDSESAGVLTVLPIRNGFLICTRSFNPNGPDRVDALYSGNVEELGPLLVAELAAARLKK